jgi:hypothetical protein
VNQNFSSFYFGLLSLVFSYFEYLFIYHSLSSLSGLPCADSNSSQKCYDYDESFEIVSDFLQDKPVIYELHLIE